MDQQLSHVSFVRQTGEPTDHEVRDMVDDVIFQALGPRGLREIIRQGDRVVLKVNLVGPISIYRNGFGVAVLTSAVTVQVGPGLLKETGVSLPSTWL